MKILCIGHSAYDITIPMDHFPIQNTKYRVSGVIENGGGPANNAAYLVAKWGLKPYYAGVVGNDEFGKRIKKELKDIGINTKYLEVSNKYKTSVSYIIANLSNSSRTILGNSNEDIKPNIKKINIKPDIILVDGYHYELAKKTLLENKGAIKVIDAGRANEHIIELSKLVDYLVCSRDFAEQFTSSKIDVDNPESYINIYRQLEENFKNKIVITIGSKGSIFRNNSNEIKIMPPYIVKAKDTTGAGDIFHGAFLYGLAKKYDFEKIIKISNIAGALSTTKIGGKQSMPSLEEVMEAYNNNVI